MVDFRRGHAVIFGASGWGKTTFLRTLVATLAATHSPTELHVYILDFGGRQMNVLRDLPHVGEIITPDEEEKVTRLLRRLDQELNRRKTVLSDADADDTLLYTLTIDSTDYSAGALTQVQQSGIAPGNHKFRVRVEDSFGDADTLAWRKFTVTDTSGAK